MMIFVKYLQNTSKSLCSCSSILRSSPARFKSSKEWLHRQFSDPYVLRAKMENYRCRSAFKLIEMNEKFHILSPGKSVIDCGAAPGSWTQVAVTNVNANGKDPKAPKGKVIAIDRLAFHAIDGAIILPNADFTAQETQSQVKKLLDNEKVDVVLSDMAPNATGVKDLDHELIVKLAYIAIRFALPVTKPGGTCLIKLWEGGRTAALVQDLSRFYKTVRHVKPKASRSDSSELFLLASDFRGIKA